MAKSLSLVSVLAAAAVAGYLVSAQMRAAGPASGLAETAAAAASEHAATASLRAAATALEGARAASGTYAGVELGAFGVRLVRADAASYCIEAGEGPAVAHLAGPGGTAAPGGC